MGNRLSLFAHGLALTLIGKWATAPTSTWLGDQSVRG
jgi:hypothetical protein